MVNYNNYLLIGGLKGIIYICNINTYQKISEIYAHRTYATSLLILNKEFYFQVEDIMKLKNGLFQKCFVFQKLKILIVVVFMI